MGASTGTREYHDPFVMVPVVPLEARRRPASVRQRVFSCRTSAIQITVNISRVLLCRLAKCKSQIAPRPDFASPDAYHTNGWSRLRIVSSQ